ncbi:MAG: guanylate kinase [Oscillospiraceae bacterium]|nr:guanylate kinase [Oscillospiraceae bacterium]
MHHLYYLMGKSASGKDTIYKRLLERFPMIQPMVLHTTRPKRAGEQEGREYFFISAKQLVQMRDAERLIEERTYHTKKGDWTYCTAKDSIDLQSGSYLGIGTPESYGKIRAYYGADAVIPVYISVEDGVRLQRALDRERAQEVPNYAELCRRFLADAQDFSEEKLTAAGIAKHFSNDDLAQCIAEITDYFASFGE